jgi:hypothetical protein
MDQRGKPPERQKKNPGRDKIFFFSPKWPDRLWDPSLLFNGYRASSPEVKWPGSKVDHSPPSRVEAKNEWSYTSNPSTCLNRVVSDNFTFTFYLMRLKKVFFMGCEHGNEFSDSIKCGKFLD